MKLLRYYLLVLALIVALIGVPLAYTWGSHNQQSSVTRKICEAVNKVEANQVAGWNYLEDRIRSTHAPNEANALGVLEHLKSLSPQAVCK